MTTPRKARRAKQKAVVTPVDPMARVEALMAVRRLVTCKRVTLKPANVQMISYW